MRHSGPSAAPPPLYDDEGPPNIHMQTNKCIRNTVHFSVTFIKLTTLSFSQTRVIVGKVQVLLTLTMALFYSGVLVRYDCDSEPTCTIPGLLRMKQQPLNLLFTLLLCLL